MQCPSQLTKGHIAITMFGPLSPDITALVGQVISHPVLMSNERPTQTNRSVSSRSTTYPICINTVASRGRMMDLAACLLPRPLFLCIPLTYEHRDTRPKSRPSAMQSFDLGSCCNGTCCSVNGRWLVTVADCRGSRARLIKFACSDEVVFSTRYGSVSCV
jgi:hypothetical protein